MMRNVEYEVRDGKLVITVDLSRDTVVSANGRSISIATTGNFISIGGDMAFLLNVNKRLRRERENSEEAS